MPPAIKIEGLTKRFGDNVVIERLDLTIQPGEVAVLQGPSGVGKSTLLRTLTYLEPFQAGRILLGELELSAGMDVRKERARIRAARRQTGFVFQFFNLFPHRTVLENLMLGPVQVLKLPLKQARAEALSLLERVGLAEKAGAYPAALSGGQQQRVGIARALAMHPRTVLFDEPTASLDPDMKQEMVQVIREFAKDKLTLLIVTHEPAVIESIATRVIKLGPRCAILSDQRNHVSG